jgi:hypothetical protein
MQTATSNVFILILLPYERTLFAGGGVAHWRMSASGELWLTIMKYELL